jgi:glutamyl-tRNA synthetase
LLKDRAETLNQLAEGALLFCRPFEPASDELMAEVLTPEARVLLRDFASKAISLPQWNTENLAALIKQVLADHEVKMPKLAIPLRVAVTGQKQTPAVDAVLALVGRDKVLGRLAGL